MRRACALALALLAAGAGHAQDAEEAGLLLADATAAQPQEQPTRGLRLSLEPALVSATARPGGATQAAQRLSIDLSLQASLAPGWRFVAADRLDLTGPGRLPGTPSEVNTLKELYASGRLGRQDSVDLGRVNARHGVAMGYNPTDFLRDQSVRSATSVDPASLRENRMGTVMLRGQHLWNGGSASALLAPRLANGPSTSRLGADIGATNQRTRWLLAGSHALAADFAPQWLLHGDGQPGGSPQLGLNLTRLLNDACVGFLEGATGRSASLLALSQQRPLNGMGWRSRLATGLTCSTSYNLALTLEYDRNGAALDAAGWRALQAGPLAGYLAYRNTAQAHQDPPTRDNLFLFARWQNAFTPRLDLSGLLRSNRADSSRLAWLEARYRWPATDLAVQWQLHSGSGLSEYGALPQQRIWQVLLRHFF